MLYMARAPSKKKPQVFKTKRQSKAQNANLIVKNKEKELEKKIVSVLHKQVEDKQAWLHSGNTYISFNSGINASGDMLQVIPNIGQGVDTHQRMGDDIRAKKCRISGNIRLLPNNSLDVTTLTAMYVRMFVVSFKNRSNYTDATGQTTALASLLKKGGTTTAWTGVLSDLNAPVNTDEFTVHAERKFYLSQSNIQSSGASAPSARLVTDLRNTMAFFNINLKCKNKKLMYDGTVGSDLQPTNWAPFILLGYCWLDGSSPDTLSTNLQMEYGVDFRFEDI